MRIFQNKESFGSVYYIFCIQNLNILLVLSVYFSHTIIYSFACFQNCGPIGQKSKKKDENFSLYYLSTLTALNSNFARIVQNKKIAICNQHNDASLFCF
jgi:hypothetical protein